MVVNILPCSSAHLSCACALIHCSSCISFPMYVNQIRAELQKAVEFHFPEFLQLDKLQESPPPWKQGPVIIAARKPGRGAEPTVEVSHKKASPPLHHSFVAFLTRTSYSICLVPLALGGVAGLHFTSSPPLPSIASLSGCCVRDQWGYLFSDRKVFLKMAGLCWICSCLWPWTLASPIRDKNLKNTSNKMHSPGKVKK